MKKIINFILILIMFLGGSSAFCEKLPSDIFKYEKKGAYPEYKEYFQEYFEILQNAYKPQEHFPKRMFNGTDVYYLLHKDGTISDFKIDVSSVEDYEYINPLYPIARMRVKKYGPKMDEYVIKTILDNPPKPFPPEIEYDELRMHVQVGYMNENESEVGMSGISHTNKVGEYYPPKFGIIIIINSFK